MQIANGSTTVELATLRAVAHVQGCSRWKHLFLQSCLLCICHSGLDYLQQQGVCNRLDIHARYAAYSVNCMLKHRYQDQLTMVQTCKLCMSATQLCLLDDLPSMLTASVGIHNLSGLPDALSALDSKWAHKQWPWT